MEPCAAGLQRGVARRLPCGSVRNLATAAIARHLAADPRRRQPDARNLHALPSRASKANATMKQTRSGRRCTQAGTSTRGWSHVQASAHFLIGRRAVARRHRRHGVLPARMFSYPVMSAITASDSTGTLQLDVTNAATASHQTPARTPCSRSRRAYRARSQLALDNQRQDEPDIVGRRWRHLHQLAPCDPESRLLAAAAAPPPGHDAARHRRRQRVLHPRQQQRHARSV